MVSYEGDDVSLDSFDQILVTYFKIRIGRRVGPLPHHAKRGVHLNRIIECNDEGYTWQADPKHVENLLEVLNMKDCSPAVTPGTKDTGKNERHAEKELIGEARQAMCSAAGICQYLSADRKDIQFSAKEVMRHISKPCLLGLLKVKRLARFLKGHKTLVYVYKFQDKPEGVDVVVDANYADEASHSRKSTSSGDIFMGGHLLDSYSVTQDITALASGESEFYSINSGCARGMEVKHLLEWLEDPNRLTVHSDATAAIGMSSRLGTAKVRHLETRWLWHQELVKKRVVTLKKRPTEKNTSDLGTKYTTETVLKKLIEMSNLRYQ